MTTPKDQFIAKRRLVSFRMLAAATSLMLFGCGEPQKPTSSTEPSASQGEATPTPRIRVERRPGPTPEIRGTVAPARGTPATSPSQVTTTSTIVEGEATPTPAPIELALSALEQIPITIADRVTTHQVDQVRAAIINLELEYKKANMIIGDRMEAQFQDKFAELEQLASQMLEAQNAEQLRETYRKVSEGLKLMDAEIQEQNKAWRERSH